MAMNDIVCEILTILRLGIPFVFRKRECNFYFVLLFIHFCWNRPFSVEEQNSIQNFEEGSFEKLVVCCHLVVILNVPLRRLK